MLFTGASRPAVLDIGVLQVFSIKLMKGHAYQRVAISSASHEYDMYSKISHLLV